MSVVSPLCVLTIQEFDCNECSTLFGGSKFTINVTLGTRDAFAQSLLEHDVPCADKESGELDSRGTVVVAIN